MIHNFEGCLVGAAVGDALGMPTEALTPTKIKKRFSRVKDYEKPWYDNYCFFLKPGQYTDDTQLTIKIAESIVEKKKIDPDDIARKTADCLLNERPRGWGKATKESTKRLIGGWSWKKSGKIGATGCGTAMKISPVGLLYAYKKNFKNGIIRDCKNISIMTHNDPRAIVGAAIQSYSITYIMQHIADFSTTDYLDELISFAEYCENKVKKTNDTISRRLVNVKNCLDLKINTAVKKIGTDCYVNESLPCAIYFFIKEPFDFEKAVLNAVNSGGDSDSIASMTGALSGALNTIHKIPGRFKKGLENYDKIINLADKLYEVANGKHH